MKGEKPITKNIRVIDAAGNEYEATYPKRAKGLAKNGRARFIDEHTLCLACPPNKSHDDYLEDKSMNNSFLGNAADVIGGTVENAVDVMGSTVKNAMEVMGLAADKQAGHGNGPRPKAKPVMGNVDIVGLAEYMNSEDIVEMLRILPDDMLAKVSEIDIAELAEIIHPAGFFNQKAVYLKAVTEWYAKYNFDVPTVQRESLEKLRPEMLSVKGVGKETADSILLYAFDFPTFVVDAYTMRLCERYPIDVGKDYDAVKAYFEENLPCDVNVYNNYHAMIVINAKEHCRKSKPLCGECSLGEICKKKF